VSLLVGPSRTKLINGRMNGVHGWAVGNTGVEFVSWKFHVTTSARASGGHAANTAAASASEKAYVARQV